MTRASRAWGALLVAIFATGSARAQVGRSMALHALHAVRPPPLTWTYPPQYYSSAPARPSVPNEREMARREISTVVQSLQRQFRESAEYTAALSAVRSTQQAYQETSRAALADVRTSREYKLKQLELNQAEEQLDQARKKSSNPQTITEAARRCLTARAAMRKLESEAIAADPSIAAAKQAWVDATTQLRQLVQQFESSIPADRQWRAARDRLDAARQVRLASAE